MCFVAFDIIVIYIIKMVWERRNEDNIKGCHKMGKARYFKGGTWGRQQSA